MRYLTQAECNAFDVEGGQNEVTPIIKDDKVIAVLIYTGHASGWREPRRRERGHPTYGRLVEAADKKLTS